MKDISVKQVVSTRLNNERRNNPRSNTAYLSIYTIIGIASFIFGYHDLIYGKRRLSRNDLYSIVVIPRVMYVLNWVLFQPLHVRFSSFHCYYDT